MPAGEVIGAALGIVLLIIVAYVLIGSVMTTSEIVVAAQKDVSVAVEARGNTRMEVTSSLFQNEGAINITVENTGGETITDFNEMEIITTTNCDPVPLIHWFSTTGATGSWNVSKIEVGTVGETQHLGTLDPGETMTVGLSVTACTPTTAYITLITNNGVIAATTVTG
jgi:flagellar protein FlaF